MKVKPYSPPILPLEGLNWAGMVTLIGEANRAIARYDGILRGIINPDVLLSPLTTQEAVLSSRIEGTQATLEQVLEHEATPGKNPEETENEKDIKEILNYRQSMQTAREELKKRPISLNLIKKLHYVLLNSVRGKNKARGKFRKEQNFIARPGAPIEEATYIPPDGLEVEEYMSNLEKYIHYDEKDRLVQLAIIHAQFELIHPFLDGNGRVGRILIPLFLYEKGILSTPMFYISAYLEANRETYYGRLRRISKENDWDGWIRFFLQAVIKQATANSEKAQDILKLYEEMKQKVTEITKSKYSIQALDTIFYKPIFSVPDFVYRSGIPDRTARRIISDLENSNHLVTMRQAKGTRPAIFVFQDLIEVIEERKFV